MRFLERVKRLRRGRGAEPAPDPVSDLDAVQIEVLVREATEQHRRGQLADAAEGYARAHALDPGRPEVNYLLGSVLGQLGRLDAARGHLQAALDSSPDLTEARVDLGHVLRSQGLGQEALAAYREALAGDPVSDAARRGLAHLLAELGRTVEAESHLSALLASGAALAEDLYLGGNLAQSAGAPGLAIERYRAGLALAPQAAALHLNLGVALEQTGDMDGALAAHRAAIEAEPGLADAHYNAGMLEARRGRLEQALSDFEQAIACLPEFLAARRQRAACLMEVRSVEAGLAELRALLALEPGLPEVHLDVGAALHRLGRGQEAEASLREALRLEPELAPAHAELGMVLAGRAALTPAARSLQRALELAPGLALAHNNLGAVRQMQAELDEAMSCYTRALELDPDRLETRSNLLACWNYHPAADPAEVFALHRDWAERCRARQAASATPPRSTRRPPGERLRVGYLSPDFRAHSVAFFFAPLLLGHDGGIETFGFASVPRPDAVTARLRAGFDHWFDVARLDDAALAALIAAQDLDVLVDLAGHTAGNRLGALALSPAAVQATYLGYPNTTGLDSVRARIVDAATDPPGQLEGYHSERLLRLPRVFLCYEPPPSAPAPRVEGGGGGAPRFVSFNELLKVCPEAVETWSEILALVPGSTLTLKGTALADAGTRERIAQRFQRHGVSPDRLHLLGRTPSLEAHLAAYRETDIGLDTFPYNGTTTTCEALWMGIPVVTLRGDRHAARVGTSLLGSLGLEELVATDRADYVQRAVALAESPLRRERLSAGMRERMLGSPLCDGPGLAAAMQSAYRALLEDR